MKTKINRLKTKNKNNQQVEKITYRMGEHGRLKKNSSEAQRSW